MEIPNVKATGTRNSLRTYQGLRLEEHDTRRSKILGYCNQTLQKRRPVERVPAIWPGRLVAGIQGDRRSTQLDLQPKSIRESTCQRKWSDRRMTNNENDDKALMDARDVSHRLSVSTRTVWRLLSANQIPKPVRIGRSVRWQREVVEEWIRSGCPDQSKQESPETLI